VRCEKIMKKGKLPPDRVVISHTGEATTPQRALTEHGLSSDVVFVRNDGWMLGATADLCGTAYYMWKDEWFGVMFPPSLDICSGLERASQSHEAETGSSGSCSGG
jgi:hypothetical protein